MSEHPTESWSAWLDGDLPVGEAASIAAHVAACVPCAAVLADLKRIVAMAGGLPDQAPAADLWPAIAPRLRRAEVIPLAPRRSARRFAFTLPQLAAAAVALILLSVGATWFVRSGQYEAGDAPGMAEGGGTPVEIMPVTEREGEYGTALAELQQAFEAAREELDPVTVRTVETNLAIIDQAIEQTRAALAADPNSLYLHTHLAETRQRKLDVLRNATTLAQTSI